MKFLRIRQVMQLTGLSRMTIYRLELAGKFPKRRQLSQNLRRLARVRHCGLGRLAPHRSPEGHATRRLSGASHTSARNWRR